MYRYSTHAGVTENTRLFYSTAPVRVYYNINNNAKTKSLFYQSFFIALNTYSVRVARIEKDSFFQRITA